MSLVRNLAEMQMQIGSENVLEFHTISFDAGDIKTVHKNQKQQLYYGVHTDETLLFLKA